MHLAHPVWLMLLILLPLMGIGALVVGYRRRKQWEAFMAPRLRGALLRRASNLPRWLAMAFLTAACAALIVALARPQGDASTKTEKSIGRNVLIAIDLSRSMRTKDVKPDRLAQAKIVIYELLDAMPNERIGLIGFAGSSHLFAPLTIDHGAVRETVEQVDESWVALGGTNLTTAVRLAISTLKETGQKNNALILLSDGEKHEGSLNQITEDAKKAGVCIFSIGVGTEDGAYVPNAEFPNSNMVGRDGKVVLSRLQPEVLRKLANETNGRYTLAGSGTDIPALAKQATKDMDAYEMKGRELRISIEFYQWLVLPAILFLIVAIVAGTRWRGVRAVTVMAIVVAALTVDVRASALSSAASHLASGDNEKAREEFGKLAAKSDDPERAARYHLGEATAAYRLHDFAGAREAFSGALLAEDPAVAANAHFGIGNSLFQLGWKVIAKEPYPADPKNLPDLARFDALVGNRLAELLKAEVPAGSEDDPVAPLESLIINWADAVKHYDSALSRDPGNHDLRHNRDTTLTYLKRLKELLEKEHNQTQQSIPETMPDPGQGEPDKSDGENDSKSDKQDKSGDSNKPKDAGGQGSNKNKPEDDAGNDPGQKPDDAGNNQAGDKHRDEPLKPDATPEDRARRILGENADLEKGPLRQGRIEYNSPEKDW